MMRWEADNQQHSNKAITLLEVQVMVSETTEES